jgi:hypothetical protein
MRHVCVILGTSVACIAMIGLVMWLVGRIVSDRYLWSQFLLWIPTPIAIGLALLGLIAAFRPGRNPTEKLERRARWAISLLLLVAYLVGIEHRFLRTPPESPQGLHIVHWNAWPDGDEPKELFLDQPLSLDPDIIILTDAWFLPWWQQSREWVAEHGGVARSIRPFTVISRIPLITARHLVSKDEIIIVLLEFDATEQLGRTLRVYAVDMPSELKLVRLDLAKEARRLLNEVERQFAIDRDDSQSADTAIPGLAPDLVIGDFNTTRESVAMRTMFPRMRHAFNEAGHGYGATFFRVCPLYHIDHVLLGDSILATRYDIIDPSVGRHRMQSVWVAPLGE